MIQSRHTIRIRPNSALARLIKAGKTEGRTVSATLHDAAAEREAFKVSIGQVVLRDQE